MKTKNGKLRLLATAVVLLAVVVIVPSCKKSSTPSLPKIGPYDNSNQVASASLLAHWTFDDNTNETISGTAASNTTATTSLVTGVKGKALQTSGGYIQYPTIAALNGANAFSSITATAWVKVDNNGSTFTSFFALANPDQTDWNRGPLILGAETGHGVTTDDTLVFHSFFSTYPGGVWLGGDNINDYGVRGTDFQTVHGTNQWVHYVMRYDATTSMIDLFANGVKVSNNNFALRQAGSPAVNLGPIINSGTVQALIGAIPNDASGYAMSASQTWQGFFTGSIDEIRVYSSALQDTDIGYLYQLELAGR